MMYKISFIFLMFLFYSVVGYFIEVTTVSSINKKPTFSRGYLIGPYLPIFGFGALIIDFFLLKYKSDTITLFVMTIFSCCTLEYFTSLLLEKLFKLRWWDYSNKKYNLNGRICLETGVLFGFGGLFIAYILSPMIRKLLVLLNNKLLITLAIIIFIIMFIDFILSTFTIVKLKVDTSKLKNLDATELVREEVKKDLVKYRYFHNRLFKAFPAITKNDANITKIKNMLNKIKGK